MAPPVGRDRPAVPWVGGSGHRSFIPGARRNTLMASCPSDEKLTGLLADALSTAERDALARHVEGCAACQEQLARLTGTSDTEMWLRAEHSPRGSSNEEKLMWRLKRMPSWLAPTGPMQA